MTIEPFTTPSQAMTVTHNGLSYTQLKADNRPHPVVTLTNLLLKNFLMATRASFHVEIFEKTMPNAKPLTFYIIAQTTPLCQCDKVGVLK